MVLTHRLFENKIIFFPLFEPQIPFKSPHLLKFKILTAANLEGAEVRIKGILGKVHLARNSYGNPEIKIK